MVIPLQGIKVVDLSQGIAGPFCTMNLGDFGAEIIKVEPIKGDYSRTLPPKIKSESSLYLALNRNKKSLAISITSDEGKKIILKILENSDIFVETYEPGNVERLDWNYTEISQVNPRLIYCSITPFGSKGPYKDRAATELEIQGFAGYQWYLGEMGNAPVRVGADVASIAAGQCALIGILAALYQRLKTGIGQKVDTSLMEALIACGSGIFSAQYNPDSWGGFLLTGPFDRPETGYRTKDRPIVFGNVGLKDRREKAWTDFCMAVGLGELLEDPYFKEWGANMVGIGRDAQEWKPVIESVFEDKTAEELQKIIDSVGGQSGIFKTYEEIFKEPQVYAIKMVRDIEHPLLGRVKMLGIPCDFSETPGEIRIPPPTLGQHTDEILKELGYSINEIDLLRKNGIIA